MKDRRRGMMDRSKSPGFIRPTDRQRLARSHYSRRERDVFTYARVYAPPLHRILLLTVLETVFRRIARSSLFQMCGRRSAGENKRGKEGN